MGLGSELVLDRWVRRTRKRTRGTAVVLVDALIRFPRSCARALSRLREWIRALTVAVGEPRLLVESAELRFKPSESSSIARRLEAGSVVMVFAAPTASSGWVLAQYTDGEVGFIPATRTAPIQ
jgi:hypothetical protein